MSTQSINSPHGHCKVPGASGTGVATLKLACSYANADGDVLFTVPDGHYLRVVRCYWLNTVAWAGGSSSAIGASSSNAAYSTKGDLQGGSGGDLTAAMGTGFKKGSAAGTAFGSNGLVILAPGDTIKFDRITSAYTSGAGYLMVEVVEVGDSAA